MIEVLLFIAGVLFGLWFFSFTPWGLRTIYFIEDCLVDLNTWWRDRRRS